MAADDGDFQGSSGHRRPVRVTMPTLVCFCTVCGASLYWDGGRNVCADCMADLRAARVEWYRRRVEAGQPLRPPTPAELALIDPATVERARRKG